MLPPLKSLILKWGLLAQWLYWAKYLQAILACSAILLPGHGHVFLLSNCPDTDSLCCQHPSYLFTDVDRCIMISVHLISTLTVIDMSFHTLESYHQASDCTENDNSQMFCQEVSSVLRSDRSGNDMLCSILFLSLGFNVLTDHFYWSACYWHFYKHW